MSALNRQFGNIDVPSMSNDRLAKWCNDDCNRYGTTTLFATLDIAIGKVFGEVHRRYRPSVMTSRSITTTRISSAGPRRLTRFLQHRTLLLANIQFRTLGP